MKATNPLRRLTGARYLGGYRVWLTFDDGREGAADLAADLWGEVFEPLRDLQAFACLRADPTLGTLVWPNGADLAPEYLYSKIARRDGN